MPVEQIKIGLIGAGGNTKLRHIPGFKALDGVEVLGVTNRTLESSKKVANEFDIPNVYENWIDMLEDPNINAICNADVPLTVAIAKVDFV